MTPNAILSVTGNPYLKHWKALSDQPMLASMIARDAAIEDYGFAIPNAEVIQAIRALDLPVIEWGAGCGYWAAMLAVAGVDVTAYDLAPVHTGNNSYRFQAEYFPVQQCDDPTVLSATARAVLLLVWPPYDEAMGVSALRCFVGSHLVYVGEDRGGCTADDEFFRELEQNWKLQQVIHIPQWPTIRDHAFFYVRS